MKDAPRAYGYYPFPVFCPAVPEAWQDVDLKITAAMIVISHPIMTDAIMSIVDIVVIAVMEMGAIITDIIKMSTIMTAAI